MLISLLDQIQSSKSDQSYLSKGEAERKRSFESLASPSSESDNTSPNHKIPLQFCSLRGHRDTILALIEINQRLLSSSTDLTIKVLDLGSLTEVTTLHGYRSPMAYLAQSNDDLVSLTSDGELKIWDLNVFAEIGTFFVTADSPISCVACVGKSFYVGYRDGAIRTFNITSHEEVSRFKAHQTSVQAISIFNDRLYSAGNVVKIWNSSTHELSKKVKDHDHQVTALTIHHGRLYTAARSIKVWDVVTLILIGTCRKHNHSIRSLVVTDTHIFSTSRVVRVWDTHSFHLLFTLRDYPERIVAMAGGENRLCSGGASGVLYIRYF